MPNAKRLIGPIKDLRNSMTHFPVEAAPTRTGTDRCLGYNLILRLLLELCFLKTMGFSDEEVSRFVDRSADYRARAQHLFGGAKNSRVVVVSSPFPEQNRD